MSKVRRRTDDMLIIRGVNVYPSQIEHVLARTEGVQAHYLIVVDRKRNLDDIEVRVEVDEALFSDVMGDMVRFQRKVAERIQAELGLRARVTLVEPGANERTAGATRRVLDMRQSE
jgi:phenylacetate-CoA ligase